MEEGLPEESNFEQLLKGKRRGKGEREKIEKGGRNPIKFRGIPSTGKNVANDPESEGNMGQS